MLSEFPITRLAAQGCRCGTVVPGLEALSDLSHLAMIFNDIVLWIIFRILPPPVSTSEVKASSSLFPLNPEWTFLEWCLPLSLCAPSARSAAGSSTACASLLIQWPSSSLILSLLQIPCLLTTVLGPTNPFSCSTFHCPEKQSYPLNP